MLPANPVMFLPMPANVSDNWAIFVPLAENVTTFAAENIIPVLDCGNVNEGLAMLDVVMDETVAVHAVNFWT